ncbi:MAG: biopolymer transporter ExbD [Elusimicrobia bacterium]|nr:biopolymer transporter ExbD [Elusimicrobiota bacterium]
MKIKTSHEPKGGLESVVFTDIILNLFIFFFVSFSLIYSLDYAKEEKIKVNLPKGEGEAMKKEISPLTLTVTEKKELYLNEERIKYKNIGEEIGPMLESRTDKTVFLNASKSLDYGFIVDILSTLHSSGARVLSLTVESKEE